MANRKTLREIAPPAQVGIDLSEDKVWLLNLDQVEPHTGRLLGKTIVDRASVGASTQVFDANVVLYSKLRPYLNKVYLPDGVGFCTSELVPLRPDPAVITREYLAAYLRSPGFLRWVEQQVDGAKMPRVSMKTFWCHQLAFPSLEEQRRITYVLDKVDSLRRKRQEAIRLADDFLRVAFVELFGDPMRNDRGWALASITSVCEDIVDCVNKTASVVDEETPFKMIRTTNVRNYRVDLTHTRCVSAETFARWTQRILPRRGDIVFTREAPVGEAGVIESDEQLFLGQRTMLYRPDLTKVTSTFLLYELMASGVQAQISKASSGSTVKHLSVPVCKEFTVRMPPIELQQRFEEIANRVRTMGSTNEASLMAVEALQKSLQADLLT